MPTMANMHRRATKAFRPDVEAEYQPALALLADRGRTMNGYLRACLRWLAADPDAALLVVREHWPTDEGRRPRPGVANHPPDPGSASTSGPAPGPDPEPGLSPGVGGADLMDAAPVAPVMLARALARTLDGDEVDAFLEAFRRALNGLDG
jgi:hypothetical protein